MTFPQRLASACSRTPESTAWLEQLPGALQRLRNQWSLELGEPFEGEEVSCLWVVPVKCADGADAVLKLGMPHMEGRHELEGLRYWNGDPTVQLIDSDVDLAAMLLERCRPGTSLRMLPSIEQDQIIPKPFIGDPAYDATQHLLNCRERLYADPYGLPTDFQIFSEWIASASGCGCLPESPPNHATTGKTRKC